MYFRSTSSSTVWVLNPWTGKKRKVTAAEWEVVKAHGEDYLRTVSDAAVATIPTEA